MNKLYQDLMTIPGVSGREERVRNYMENFMKNYTNFKIFQDKLGSIFAYKKSNNSNAKTVMVAGHMDEIGFMVVQIRKNGSLKLQALGGILGEVFVSQVMCIYPENGKIIKGVIGSVPPHLKQSQSTNVSDLVLDIGAASKDEVLSWGIRLGDMVLYENQFSYTPDKQRFISKAIDNRYGCALALEAIKKFNNIDLDFNLAIGATVQEEVGLRGAETSANLFSPDVFLALDASPVNDLQDPDSLGKLGEGFLLRMFDPRNIMHQGLLHYFVELATKKKINYQYFVSKGGTDAAKTLDMHHGILSTTIGLPARYIHSTAAIADVKDVKAARTMLFAVLKDLTHEKIKKLQEANR